MEEKTTNLVKKTSKSNGVKKTIFLTFFALFLLFLLPATAQAFEIKTGQAVSLASGQEVKGNLYAAGMNITIDGKVSGDVICAGQNINISGAVEGDVICAGQTINITGEVKGNVRIAGNSLNINSAVGKNVMAFGQSLLFGQNAKSGWDVTVFGALAQIDGQVGRDLYGSVAIAQINGAVAGNIKLTIDSQKKKQNENRLTIGSTAKISGDLTYTANQAATIESGAVISGQTVHNLPKVVAKKPTFNQAWGSLYSIFSALVIGLVLISLWREPIIKLTDKMLEKIPASLGWGFLIMFFTPVVALLLVITIIGIPLALILVGLWLIALFISNVLVGILVGRSILNNLWAKKKDSLIWAMIIGVIIVNIVFAIPLIGWILGMISIWWGLGGIMLYFKKA